MEQKGKAKTDPERFVIPDGRFPRLQALLDAGVLDAATVFELKQLILESVMSTVIGKWLKALSEWARCPEIIAGHIEEVLAVCARLETRARETNEAVVADVAAMMADARSAGHSDVATGMTSGSSRRVGKVSRQTGDAVASDKADDTRAGVQSTASSTQARKGKRPEEHDRLQLQLDLLRARSSQDMAAAYAAARSQAIMALGLRPGKRARHIVDTYYAHTHGGWRGLFAGKVIDARLRKGSRPVSMSDLAALYSRVDNETVTAESLLKDIRAARRKWRAAGRRLNALRGKGKARGKEKTGTKQSGPPGL